MARENVALELLAEVSTLGHAPRVIGVYRASELPRGVREVGVGLWQVGDPGNVGALLRSADALARDALFGEAADTR